MLSAATDATSQSAALPTAARARLIDAVELRGAQRTRTSTIVELLPRQPPALFEPRELTEFERRLNNLAIFDKVTVSLDDTRLVVQVREKWTLIPSVNFASGRTLADSFIGVGATEYNFLGTASLFTVFAAWLDRGLNGSLAWEGHPYSPRAGAPFVEASYASSFVSFESGRAWRRDQAGGAVGWQLPYLYGAPLRVRVRAFAYHERISETEGEHIPDSGVTAGSALELTWDHLSWDDLAPAGYLFMLDLSTAAFVPATEPRHDLAGRGAFAIRLSPAAVFTGLVVAEAVSTGNANHSLLLSSWQEVRGLTDSLYRDAAQLTLNLELRQAWRFAERWALQGVLFGDAAAFKPMNADGRVQPTGSALGVGCGARLIPTLVANVVPRIDVGRLLAPDKRWFFQIGLAQFF